MYDIIIIQFVIYFNKKLKCHKIKKNPLFFKINYTLFLAIYCTIYYKYYFFCNILYDGIRIWQMENFLLSGRVKERVKKTGRRIQTT